MTAELCSRAGCGRPHRSTVSGGGGDATSADLKEQLDELHKRKIDLADTVLALNVDGYIGPSTRNEIDYAEKLGRPVEYLIPPHQPGESSPSDSPRHAPENT